MRTVMPESQSAGVRIDSLGEGLLLTTDIFFGQ